MRKRMMFFALSGFVALMFLGLLGGCAFSFKDFEWLKEDQATSTGSLMTPYGSGSYCRTNMIPAGNETIRLSCSKDGVTIERIGPPVTNVPVTVVPVPGVVVTQPSPVK